MSKTSQQQIEPPKLGLIVPPPTDVEEACLRLDTALDKVIVGIKEMRKAVKFLRTKLEHPFHMEALDNS